jgi:hypothetical protein
LKWKFRSAGVFIIYHQKNGEKIYINVTQSKAVPLHAMDGGAWGERRYSSYSFLTSALDGGE